MRTPSLEPDTQTTIQANIFAEVKRRFAEIDDLAHGWEHVQRVYALALFLAEREEADSFIVGVAALMHDLGRTVHDHTKHHAETSVILAREILQAQSVAPDIQQAILHAIDAHSFSHNVEPRTLEACVVRDADRLDGLGATGIIRWAVTGTVRRTPQTLTYHPDDPFAQYHELDEKRYMLDHFYTKLLKLADTMATATGRTLAHHRTEVMQAFLDELRNELNTASA
jgi:uncharacterized protein